MYIPIYQFHNYWLLSGPSNMEDNKTEIDT